MKNLQYNLVQKDTSMNLQGLTGARDGLTTTFDTSLITILRSCGKINIRFSFFEKYQRRQRKSDYVVGLSTRKQGKFFRSFIGGLVSHTTSSRLIKTLKKGYKRVPDAYHRRQIQIYPYHRRLLS
jgi:hypothetical protein